MAAIIGPFIRLKVERHPSDPTEAVLTLRTALRTLGFEPDEASCWDEWLADIAAFYAQAPPDRV